MIEMKRVKVDQLGYDRNERVKVGLLGYDRYEKRVK